MSEEKRILNIEKFPILQRIPTPSSNTVAGRFAGILGLWAWPLVNLILALAENKRRGYIQPVVQERKRRMSLWDVTRDKEGRIISILEREVEE